MNINYKYIMMTINRVDIIGYTWYSVPLKHIS